MLSNGVSDSSLTVKPPVLAIITLYGRVMVTIRNQLGNCIQCTLIRGFREPPDQLASLVGEGLGPPLDTLESIVLLDQRPDLAERNPVITALLQDDFH